MCFSACPHFRHSAGSAVVSSSHRMCVHVKMSFIHFIACAVDVICSPFHVSCSPFHGKSCHLQPISCHVQPISCHFTQQTLTHPTLTQQSSTPRSRSNPPPHAHAAIIHLTHTQQSLTSRTQRLMHLTREGGGSALHLWSALAVVSASSSHCRIRAFPQSRIAGRCRIDIVRCRNPQPRISAIPQARMSGRCRISGRNPQSRISAVVIVHVHMSMILHMLP